MLDSISQKKSEIKVPGHWQDSEFTTAFPEKIISVGKRAQQARYCFSAWENVWRPEG